jgi:hypothetical protein
MSKITDYNNRKKANYRTKVFKKCKNSKNMVFIGFDAQNGKESAFLRRKYGKNLLAFINIERDFSIAKKWSKTVSGQHKKSHLRVCDALYYFEKLMTQDLMTIAEQNNINYTDLKVCINLDFIGFLSPSMLKILNVIKKSGPIHFLAINLQYNPGGIRGRRDQPSITALHKERIKRDYKDFERYKINKSLYNFKLVDDFDSTTKQVKMRNLTFLAA